MLTGSRSNFRLLSMVLEILHAQPALTAAYLSAVSPCMHLGAVVRVEPVNIRWTHPLFSWYFAFIHAFFFFLRCHLPCHYLTHSVSQQKCSHLYVNCFVSPYSFLKNRPVFFSLSSLNSLHLSNVKNSISSVTVFVVFVFSS